jgi:hypothetical protein
MASSGGLWVAAMRIRGQVWLGTCCGGRFAPERGVVMSEADRAHAARVAWNQDVRQAGWRVRGMGLERGSWIHISMYPTARTVRCLRWRSECGRAWVQGDPEVGGCSLSEDPKGCTGSRVGWAVRGACCMRGVVSRLLDLSWLLTSRERVSSVCCFCHLLGGRGGFSGPRAASPLAHLVPVSAGHGRFPAAGCHRRELWQRGWVIGYPAPRIR